METQYKAEGLTAEEIKVRRNSAEACKIIAKLASSLYEMNNIASWQPNAEGCELSSDFLKAADGMAQLRKL